MDQDSHNSGKLSTIQEIEQHQGQCKLINKQLHNGTTTTPDYSQLKDAGRA